MIFIFVFPFQRAIAADGLVVCAQVLSKLKTVGLGGVPLHLIGAGKSDGWVTWEGLMATRRGNATSYYGPTTFDYYSDRFEITLDAGGGRALTPTVQAELISQFPELVVEVSQEKSNYITGDYKVPMHTLIRLPRLPEEPRIYYWTKSRMLFERILDGP